MRQFLFVSELKCLIITLLIEIIIGMIIMKDKKYIPMIILVNILTNPLLSSILFYININYGVDLRHIVWIVLEVVVVIVEGVVYMRAFENMKVNPFVLSFILNLSSIILGDLLDTYVI